MITYQWSGPQNFSATGQSVTLSNAQAANAGSYSVSAISNVGCSNTASTIISVIPNPVAKFNLLSPAC
jgi:hypothetical protein